MIDTWNTAKLNEKISGRDSWNPAILNEAVTDRDSWNPAILNESAGEIPVEFEAIITVTFPEGATVTCTDGTTTLTATESPYTFNFNAVGTWYIKMTYNNITKIVATHNITETGQAFTDNLNWDKTTLQGVQRILDFQIEVGQLNIGDEVGVLESNVSVPYLVTAIDLYDSHEVILSRKYLLSTSKDVSGINYSNRSAVINYLTSIYNSISESDRVLLKDKTVKYQNGNSTNQITQKLWLPTQQEAGFNESSEYNLGNRTFALFTTPSSRAKQIEGGSSQIWQTASSNNYSQVVCFDTSGNVVGKPSGSYYVLPFFRLTADS